MMRPLAAMAVTLLLGGCASPGYLLQAAGGQWELWRLSQPIEAVQAEPECSADLRRKLAAALEIRDFASRDLGLPDNGSYRKYADVKRPYVVWSVFATKDLSVRAKEWCFPVAGCVNYRGYFAKDDADAFAAELRHQGYDVYVGGVPAYSTLGWFDDPLLNTFINYQEPELARIVFHELAHQKLYIPNDTEFNESFAVAVEEAGVQRWLAYRGDPKLQLLYERGREHRADFVALVRKYRKQLAELYAGDLDAAVKRREKTRILGELRTEYVALKNGRWGGFEGYDPWFAGEVNNATLASVGIYTGLLPGFRALLAAQQGDLLRFYAEAKRLADLPKEARRQALATVLAAAR